MSINQFEIRLYSESKKFLPFDPDAFMATLQKRFNEPRNNDTSEPACVNSIIEHAISAATGYSMAEDFYKLEIIPRRSDGVTREIKRKATQYQGRKKS